MTESLQNIQRHPSRRIRPLLLGLTALSVPSLALAQQATTSETTHTLNTVVITASGFEQTVKEAPASVSVITSEELEKGNFTSLTDALREVQGVVTTGIANEQDIYIRGLPGQYTLILVDGKRQNTRDARTNGNSGYEQSFIPPISAIERIEVVRGPMSSLYGSDAMGGVINVITKPVADRWSGEVKVETVLPKDSGFESSRQVSVYASGPIIADTLGLQFWGRKFDRDASSIAAGPSGADDFDLGGRLSWAVDEQNEVLFEGGRTRLTREDFGDLSQQDNDRKHWSLTHKGKYEGLQTELSYSHELGQRTSYNRTALNTGFAANLRAPEVRNDVLDAKGITNFDWNGSHNFTFGGQYLRSSIQDQNPGAQAHLPENQRYNEKFSLDQWALYVEDEWRLRDDFALTAGLRYNNHDSYGSHITPRLYGVWNATENLTLKGGVSTGFKAPEIRSIAAGYAYTTGGANCARNSPPSCGVILGNPDLKPETTTNIEFGGVYQGDEFTISAMAFHTKFKNKLQQVLTDDLWTDGPQYTATDGSRHYYRIYRNFNVDRANINGVEVAGDWNLTDNISARATYTYTKSKQKTGTFAGFPLARTPEHMASLRFDWVTPVEGLDAWVSGNYHGSEIASGLRIGTNGSPVTINGQSGRKYAAYTTLDFGGGYQVNDNAKVTAAVYNVFDKEIRSSEFNTVEEGRRLWLGVTTSF